MWNLFMTKNNAYSFGYLFFHINIAFSSIEEIQRKSIIEKCYDPILDLAEELEIPIGVEVTGYSLEVIENLRPDWILRFKNLILRKLIRLIGSGYCQIIAPLVPNKVTSFNLNEGLRIYKKILDVKPETFLINEQAFSIGLIEIYNKSGIKNIILEVENIFLNNQYDPEWKYFNQIAVDDYQNEINIIWNSSLFFQKFQRYVHGDLGLDGYLSFIKSYQKSGRKIPIYSSDVEIFNFRPGRFETEPKIQEDEWLKIKILLKELSNLGDFKIVHLDYINKCMKKINYLNKIKVNSIKSPIVVKKQAKYNITRWALSGRSDFVINTQCWRLFKYLDDHKISCDKKWRELLYLWSSDFRTHITTQRWSEFQNRLKLFSSSIDQINTKSDIYPRSTTPLSSIDNFPNYIKTAQNLIIVSNGNYELALNLDRGLSIEYFRFLDKKPQNIYGKIEHGFFSDVNLLADFYTGHLIIDFNARKKITDLVKVSPSVDFLNAGINLFFSYKDNSVVIQKNVFVSFETGDVDIRYNLDFEADNEGSIRCGFLTVHPNLLLDNPRVDLSVENGGIRPEKYQLLNEKFDYGSPVSRSVTARTCLSATGGLMRLIIHNYELCLQFDHSENAFCGFIHNEPAGEKRFLRLYLSAQEVDETFQSNNSQKFCFGYSIKCRNLSH